MPRPSPQTERLVDTFELLAAAPRDGRSLSEIARHLGIDRASCYPMLQELTRVGWLIRHPDRKTFHLGPRLAALGRSADVALDVVDLARGRIDQLANEAGVAAAISVPSGDELTIGHVALPTGTRVRSYELRPGDSIVFRPPSGAALVAWSRPSAIDAWLRRGVDLDPDVAARYRRILQVVRQRGYAIEEHRSPDTVVDAETPLPRGRGSARARVVQERLNRWAVGKTLTGDLDDGEYWPTSINAPVFDANGTVIAAVGTIERPAPTPRAVVRERVQRVLAAASDVTDTIHGHAPR
ncbi:MAG TPA: helix-turn-helix domain-containing protein [Pseudonocardia sp.]|jgi:DNA-binding IclR family transcriptional regulator|nr:helix-turn-helix domain-containing protein [Pseudonocardia sp.]